MNLINTSYVSRLNITCDYDMFQTKLDHDDLPNGGTMQALVRSESSSLPGPPAPSLTTPHSALPRTHHDL